MSKGKGSTVKPIDKFIDIADPQIRRGTNIHFHGWWSLIYSPPRKKGCLILIYYTDWYEDEELRSSSSWKCKPNHRIAKELRPHVATGRLQGDQRRQPQTIAKELIATGKFAAERPRGFKLQADVSFTKPDYIQQEYPSCWRSQLRRFVYEHLDAAFLEEPYPFRNQIKALTRKQI